MYVGERERERPGDVGEGNWESKAWKRDNVFRRELLGRLLPWKPSD